MEFTISTSKREELVDITEQVKKCIEKKGEKGNAVLVYVPHATAGIIINENYDPAVCEDIIDYLRKNIPEGKWKHDCIDKNADSHIKSSIIGPSQVIPLENGKLQLGRWQGCGLLELDGPKIRRVIVKILS